MLLQSREHGSMTPDNCYLVYDLKFYSFYMHPYALYGRGTMYRSPPVRVAPAPTSLQKASPPGFPAACSGCWRSHRLIFSPHGPIRHSLPSPMAPSPGPRSRAGVRPLPLDALYEVLLRVPAKDLCRLRGVCRPWRSLLSDPHFVVAHAARHPEPLIIAAAHPTDRSPPGHLLDIMDLSGRVIKRVVKPGSLWATSKEWVMTAQLDVVGVRLGASRSCLVLNPATGAVSALPQEFAEDNSPPARYSQLVALGFGKVSPTAEYKVLRLLRRYHYSQHHELLCEVFTLDGSNNARWRRKKAPTVSVQTHPWSRVAIDGIAYFLSWELVMDQGVFAIRIASFDLETEEWRPILRGPPNLLCVPGLDCSLASLNGCLVMIHHIKYYADLWFLMDFEKDLWAKQHSIPVKSGLRYDEIPVRPLLVLNDGRILFYEEIGLLKIYDPKTCTCTDVAEIGPCYEIGLYTGNLLSLPDDARSQLRGAEVEI